MAGTPRPVPKLLVVNSGSRMRVNTSAGMPGPLSRTSITAPPSRSCRHGNGAGSGRENFAGSSPCPTNASLALVIRLTMARCNRDGSNGTCLPLKTKLTSDGDGSRKLLRLFIQHLQQPVIEIAGWQFRCFVREKSSSCVMMLSQRIMPLLMRSICASTSRPLPFSLRSSEEGRGAHRTQADCAIHGQPWR